MLNRHKSDPHYHRRFGIDYLKTRMMVEKKLRDCFVARGGKPNRKYPVYFVLGESKWFHSLNGNHVSVQIPISALPNDRVSVLNITSKSKSGMMRPFNPICTSPVSLEDLGGKAPCTLLTVHCHRDFHSKKRETSCSKKN
jgi:hypothetical protein